MKAHMARCNESDRDVSLRCHLYRGGNGEMLCVTHPMSAEPTVEEEQTCRLCGEAASKWHFSTESSTHLVCDAAMRDQYWNEVLWGDRESYATSQTNPNMAAIGLRTLKEKVKHI